MEHLIEQKTVSNVIIFDSSVLQNVVSVVETLPWSMLLTTKFSTRYSGETEQLQEAQAPSWPCPENDCVYCTQICQHYVDTDIK